MQVAERERRAIRFSLFDGRRMRKITFLGGGNSRVHESSCHCLRGWREMYLLFLAIVPT
mgnify:CR=1 FL=1